MLHTMYTVNTLNRYFGIVTLTKMEIFQVRYDENDRMIEVIQRYSKSSFLDAFEPLKMFLSFWLNCTTRRQFKRYVFELEKSTDAWKKKWSCYGSEEQRRRVWKRIY